jgi:hypothetical protein
MGVLCCDKRHFATSFFGSNSGSGIARSVFAVMAPLTRGQTTTKIFFGRGRYHGAVKGKGANKRL